jgi:hypothetical protein
LYYFIVNIIIGSTKETYRHQQYFYVISQLLSDIGIIMKTNHICANNIKESMLGISKLSGLSFLNNGHSTISLYLKTQNNRTITEISNTDRNL